MLAIAALADASVTAPRADSETEFYKGKQIKLVVGTTAGGAYDVYARTIVRHMGRHLPGNPTFIAQNMRGAGGRTAADWLYNLAPRDGSVIGTISQSAPLDQLRKQSGTRFDAAKFGWIGNPVIDNLVTVAWSDSGLATIADVKNKGGLICGASGASTPGMVNPQILNTMLGTKIRIVPGYSGILQISLAMQQGEVNCMGAYSWSSMRSEVSGLLNTHKLNMLVQWGPEANRELSAYQGWEVPLISDLVENGTDRKVLRLVNSGVLLGRPLLVPPGVVPGRLDALRKAFDATMKDPEFLAEAAAQNLDVAPVSGETLQKVVSEIARTDDVTLARANEVMTSRDMGVKENK
jgi:tripartite-type tricarboxylate transporter receptor subunit TctC